VCPRDQPKVATLAGSQGEESMKYPARSISVIKLSGTIHFGEMELTTTRQIICNSILFVPNYDCLEGICRTEESSDRSYYSRGPHFGFGLRNNECGGLA